MLTATEAAAADLVISAGINYFTAQLAKKAAGTLTPADVQAMYDKLDTDIATLEADAAAQAAAAGI